MKKNLLKKALAIIGCVFCLTSCKTTTSEYDYSYERDETNKYVFNETTFIDFIYSKVNEEELKVKLIEPNSQQIPSLFKEKRYCYIKADGTCKDTKEFSWTYQIGIHEYETTQISFIYDIRKTTKVDVFYDLTGLFGIVAISDYVNEEHVTEVVGHDMSDSFTIKDKLTFSFAPDVPKLTYVNKGNSLAKHYKDLYTVLFFDLEEEIEYWVMALKSMTYLEQSCTKMNGAFFRTLGTPTCRIEGQLTKHTTQISDDNIVIPLRGSYVTRDYKVKANEKLNGVSVSFPQLGFTEDLVKTFEDKGSNLPLARAPLHGKTYNVIFDFNENSVSDVRDLGKEKKYYVFLKNRGINTTNLIVESIYFNIDGTERFTYVNDKIFRNEPFNMLAWIMNLLNIPSWLGKAIIAFAICLALSVVLRLFGFNLMDLIKGIYKLIIEIIKMPYTIYKAIKLVLFKTRHERKNIKKARHHAEELNEKALTDLDAVLVPKIKEVN